MKRKLLAIALALVMCCSSITAIASTGTGDIDIATKNLTPFGSFDSLEEYEENVFEKSSQSKWVESTTSKGGYVATSPSVAWYGTQFGLFPLVAGETYDIYFDAKIDEGTDGWGILVFEESLNGPLENVKCVYDSSKKNLSTQWQTMHVTIRNFPATSQGGIPIDGGSLSVTPRRDAGGGSWLYVDNLRVYARGNAKYDWENYIRWLDGKRDSDNYDDGFPTEQPIGNTEFFDVSKNHWANDAIRVLAGSQYVQGMGDGTYSPEGKVTRAEFITMAYNILKYDKVGYKALYGDVKEGQWFADAIITMSEIDMIDENMVSDGNFFPDKPITREEAATILVKLAKLRGAEYKNSVSHFADNDAIADWTKLSVNKAVRYGLFSGYPDETFRPKNTITRAETAQVYFRLVELTSRMAVYVDPVSGDDGNDGTKETPLQTIDAAREMVQPYLEKMQNHIYVLLKGGEHNLDGTVKWETKDSGCNGYNVIYTSADAEQAEVIMANHYEGFELHDAEKNIWKVYVGQQGVRQVYINGVRAVRSRTEERDKKESCLDNYTTGWDGDSYIWTSKSGYFVSDNVELAEISNPEYAEIILNVMWDSEILKVKDIYAISDTQVRIDADPQSWDSIWNESDSHAGMLKPMRIENAYELINTPGEWYINEDDGYLYYKPRAYEDPATLKATIPSGNGQGFIVAGDSTQDKIHNLVFDNLAFKYNTWLFPNEHGLRSHLGNFIKTTAMFTYEGDGRSSGGKEDAFVTILDAAYVDVTNCEFSHLGSAGLFFTEVFQNCEVVGNRLYDISGTAIMMGHTDRIKTDKWNRTHTTRYENYCINNNLINNVVHDTGIDFEAAPAVMVADPINSRIEHNEIYNTPYVGLFAGYIADDSDSLTTFRGNSIKYNYLHNNMQTLEDGGSFYMFGACGGLNEINENYFENNSQCIGTLYFDSHYDHWNCIENVFDLREETRDEKDVKWLFGNNSPYDFDGIIAKNYTTSNRGDYPSFVEETQYVPDANWSPRAAHIIDNAGLTDEYIGNAKDTVQRIKLEDKFAKEYLSKGQTYQLEVTKMGRKLEDLGKDGIVYYSSDDSVATVDENGLVTCVGRGRATVYAEYLDGEVVRRAFKTIICDAQVIDITTDLTKAYIIEGETTDITAAGKLQIGEDQRIIPTVVIDDPSIVSFDSETGTLKGLKNGTTVVTAFYERDGVSKVNYFEAEVVRYNNGKDTLAVEEISWKPTADDDFFKASSWTVNSKNLGNGILELKSDLVTGGPTVYKNRLTKETQFVSFDVTINSPGNWPSFTFNLQEANSELSHTEQDVYLIGIAKEGIELQRFNNGNRTYMFGWMGNNPICGNYYLNRRADDPSALLYDYGKTYSVTIGTQQVDNGVRVVFILNGLPIFDFVDDMDGYIDGPGYFGIFETTGNFVLEPFTGRTFE